jgi:hypothetical protein
LGTLVTITNWNVSLKYNIILNLKNIPGKRIKRKLVVIECDDWGGIRMPSRDVYDLMLRSDIPIPDRWSQIDTLADKQDLEYLFDVLLSVRDKNGHPAVMTPVTNVANPDFARILESGYTQYFYEPFTDTLVKYGRHPDTFITWKKGIELGIFVPESHGREHITVQLWMQKLREGDTRLQFAFNHGFVSVHSSSLPSSYQCYRPEFYFNNADQIDFLKNSITDGVRLFKDIFGYIPHAFVPSNGIFHPSLERTLAETGVRYLHIGHISYVPDANGTLKPTYYKVGKKTSDGLTYYTRNCAFEPIDPEYKGINLTMQQIEAAFRWGKPAILSSHRVNFVGVIDKENREKGLRELKILLDTVVKKWPDVEFVSLGELLSYQYETV